MKSIILMLLVIILITCSCYPQDTGHWPNKPDPDDPWKIGIFIVVVSAFVGWRWYAKKQQAAGDSPNWR